MLCPNVVQFEGVQTTSSSNFSRWCSPSILPPPSVPPQCGKNNKNIWDIEFFSTKIWISKVDFRYFFYEWIAWTNVKINLLSKNFNKEHNLTRWVEPINLLWKYFLGNKQNFTFGLRVGPFYVRQVRCPRTPRCYRHCLQTITSLEQLLLLILTLCLFGVLKL